MKKERELKLDSVIPEGGPRPELTVEEKRERMRNMVKSLAEYMATHDQQKCYENYRDETFIDDVLYGLGLALDSDKFQYASGYDDFRTFLVIFLIERLESRCRDSGTT